jgi:hypothetical protein
MRTTLDLPDELFRQLKAKAALEGTKLKDLLTRFVEAGLGQPASSSRPPLERSKLPVIKRRRKKLIPNLTPELQARLEQEEDFAKLDRSFRR